MSSMLYIGEIKTITTESTEKNGSTPVKCEKGIDHTNCGGTRKTELKNKNGKERKLLPPMSMKNSFIFI